VYSGKSAVKPSGDSIWTDMVAPSAERLGVAGTHWHG
jgi:hypothetical protein